VPTAEYLTLKELRAATNSALTQFSLLEGKALQAIGSELDPVADVMHRFLLDSGKRLRPVFALVGYLGSGPELTPAVVQAAASLELVHVCALMHDDVMDASDTRRGAPSVHRAFEAMHRQRALAGNDEQFGISAAILLGDLALIWSAKMLHTAGLDLDALIRCQEVYDEMRIELMAGQYLDVYEQVLGSESVERSLKVARYKSGKYTIERPLHFGAALGSPQPAQLQKIYSQYGLPLGEAFQLRDDVLGVFGNPEETGKPAGDDLREGKRTVLLAKTMERVSSSERSLLESIIGSQELGRDQVESARSIIRGTGALDELEELISSLTHQALASLDTPLLAPRAVELLRELTTIVTQRNT
jgi:geranylgeranyl diphosphate synthase type I